MNRILFLIVFTLVLNYTHAQTVSDALRFTNLQTEGTARTVGLGGAFGAIGADYTTISTNPAGLAVFRNSELVLTPALNIINTNATLLNSTTPRAFDEKKINFNFSNIGFVINNTPSNSKWKTSNWALGFNRIANFHGRHYYQGNSLGSITERWVEQANAGQFLDYESNLAIETGAVFYFDKDTAYVNDFAFSPEDPLVEKSQQVATKGGINEMVLSYGTNFQNRLMIGFTIGVPFIKYEEERDYYEMDDNDSIFIFDDLHFSQNLTIEGIGANLKVGAIYRINQMFRVGLAVHTPTRYSLSDTFSNTLEYGYTLDDPYTGVPTPYNFESSSPDGEFTYRLRTPWRFLGSLGVIIRKIGLLSAELEWVDYGAASFNLATTSDNPDDKAYELELNDNISNQLGRALNFRAGAEYAYKKFRFRGGISINGTPYAADNIINKAYSAGIGIREQNFYMDFAYRLFKQEDQLTPYVLVENPDRAQLVEQRTNQNKFLLTFGVKF